MWTDVSVFEATTVNYLAPDNPDRKAEVTASLGKFGIGSARIEFLSLPDGGIDPSNPDIQQAIKQASLESTVAFTLGPQGGVGEHNDHSSLHETVLNVGQQTRTFVLNNHNQGTVQLQVTPDDRLAVLSAHPSQFQVVMGVQQGWQQIGKYSVGPETQKVLNEWDGLILNGSETYDIYQASSA